MAVPTLELSPDSPFDSSADALVVMVRSGRDGVSLASEHPSLSALGPALGLIGVRGSADQLTRLPSPADGVPPLALIGLGGETTDPDAVRAAVGSALRQLSGLEHVAIALPDGAGPDHAAAALEGAAVGAYAFTGYRTGERPMPAERVTVHGDGHDRSVEMATALATAVHTVRDLVATPALDLYPESFAARVGELAEGLPVEVEVLDEDALREGGYGGIAGVGGGSSRAPRLVVVRYRPEGAGRHLSLVGKGITFDTGGLSLKPAPAMVGMKYDMTGAATVLAVVLAAARLGLPLRVTARLCLAENMPSGSAIRPNDVLRMRNGTTVEVLNTDAEGRLVLADGLADASDEHPDALIDVATLTGAARLAMGERITPVMGDPSLAADIVAAGQRSGEGFWAMPLPAELRATLESDVADLANAKPGSPNGGMMVAGLFLQHFVGRTGEGPDAPRIPWAHLDIAGVANNSGRPWGSTPKGPTGATTRTLIRLAEAMSVGTASAPDPSEAE